MNHLFYPQNSYSLQIKSDEFNERYVLSFRAAPEDFVKELLMAVGFIPFENGKKYYLKDDKNLKTEQIMKWTQELKDCLAVQCFPREVPYLPENPPSEANLQNGFYTLITIEYKTSSGSKTSTQYLGFDFSDKKRKGFANLFGKIEYGDRFISAKAARGNLLKKAKPLFGSDKTIISIPSPFGAGCPPLNRKDDYNKLEDNSIIPIVDEYNKQIEAGTSEKVNDTDSSDKAIQDDQLNDDKSQIQRHILADMEEASKWKNVSAFALGSNKENSAESAPKSNNESLSKIDTESNTKSNTETSTESVLETNEESGLKTNSDSEKEKQSEDKSEDSLFALILKELRKDKDAKNEQESVSETNTDSDLKTNTESVSETNRDSSTERGTKTNTDSVLETEAESDLEYNKGLQEKTDMESTSDESTKGDLNISEEFTKNLDELFVNNDNQTSLNVDPKRKREIGIRPELKASSTIDQPYTEIFMKLHELIPNLQELLEKGNLYMKSTFNKEDGSDKSALMDFSVELLQSDSKDKRYTISMSHYFKMNGDLVPDPDMSVTIDFLMQTAEARHFQNQASYTELDKKTPPYIKDSINEFLLQWIKNLIDQGHILDEFTIIDSGYDDEVEIIDEEQEEKDDLAVTSEEDSEQIVTSEEIQTTNTSKEFLPDGIQLKLAIVRVGIKKTEDKQRLSTWSEVEKFESDSNFNTTRSDFIEYEVYWEDNTTFGGQINLADYDHKSPILATAIVSEIVHCIHSLEGRLQDYNCFVNASIDQLQTYLNTLDFGFDIEDKLHELSPKIPLSKATISTNEGEYHYKQEGGSYKIVEQFLKEIGWAGNLISQKGEPKVIVTVYLEWADGKVLSFDRSPINIPSKIEKSYLQELIEEFDKSLIGTHQTRNLQALLFPTEYLQQQNPKYYKSLVSTYYQEGTKGDHYDIIVIDGANLHTSKLKAVLLEIFQKMTLVDALSILNKLSTRLDQLTHLERFDELMNSPNYSPKLKAILTKDISLETEAEKFRAEVNGVFVSILDSFGELAYGKNHRFEVLIELLCSDDEKLVDLPTKPNEDQSEKTLTQKKRLDLNTQIEALLNEKGKKDNYSEEDKKLLEQYSGSGGLKQAGATKGRLYEFYTPIPLVNVMWDLARRYGYKGGDVLDPAIGTGHFVRNVKDANRIVGFEINEYAAMICRILTPEVDLVEDHFESIFFRGNKHLKNDFSMKPFDLVIGNPPYGKFASFYAGLGEKDFTKALEYDQYFITRGLDVLKSGGLLVMLISSHFLRAGSRYDKVKMAIAEKSVILYKRSLPNSSVPYTEVGTDIIIFKKR